MTRIAALIVSLTLIGCGAPPSVWLREVHTLAAAPLECGRAEIATFQVGLGHSYDSIGCDRVIRHTCSGRVCTPVGDVASSTGPGYIASSQRIADIDEIFALRASEVVEFCGEGHAVGATFLVSAAGDIENVHVSSSLAECFRRAIGHLPSGRGALMITRVFR